MKKERMRGFVSGAIATVLVFAMTTGIFAASKSITVNDDMKLMIDGAQFIPKDVNGKAVPVLEYNGTTYVPIRGVANGLGCAVGYDATTRTAIIVNQQAAAYEASLACSAVDNFYTRLYEYWETMYSISYLIINHRDYSYSQNEYNVLSIRLDVTVDTLKDDMNKSVSTLNQLRQAGYSEEQCQQFNKMFQNAASVAVTFQSLMEQFGKLNDGILSGQRLNEYINSLYAAKDKLVDSTKDITNTCTILSLPKY